MVYLGKSRQRDMYFGAKPELFRYAEDMRKNPTPAEEILWKHLRKFRHKGYIFRRQHPIDIFIADFYCHKIRLVIEVDGEIHFNDQVMAYDDGRSGEIERLGIKVLRFPNHQVLQNLDNVIAQIIKSINDLEFGLGPLKKWFLNGFDLWVTLCYTL